MKKKIKIKEHSEKKHGKNVPIKEKLLAGQQLLSSHFGVASFCVCDGNLSLLKKLVSFTETCFCERSFFVKETCFCGRNLFL